MDINYYRHSSMPLYTPEPDIVHELLGHAPMFADTDFADFSQEIGLASLGVDDDTISKLSTCYWHSVEFGLVKRKQLETSDKNSQNNSPFVAYGAGLLSSFGEMEYACNSTKKLNDETQIPLLKSWEPEVAAITTYPITTYQPIYFVADSLTSAKEKMRSYCDTLPKPFYSKYNVTDGTISIEK